MVNTSQHHQQQQHQQQLSQQQPLQKLKTKRSSSGSSNGSNEKPPQLPPRDSSIYAHELPTVSIASRQVSGHEHAYTHTSGERGRVWNLYNKSWLIAQLCACVVTFHSLYFAWFFSCRHTVMLLLLFSFFSSANAKPRIKLTFISDAQHYNDRSFIHWVNSSPFVGFDFRLITFSLSLS